MNKKNIELKKVENQKTLIVLFHDRMNKRMKENSILIFFLI